MRMALTFDDGPNTVITPQVLDILEEYGIPATFFLIAQNITPRSAEVARRALSLGCDLENHSLTHSKMDQMAPEEIRAEIRVCSEKITEISGRAPRFFRPPFIAVSPTLFESVDLTFICGEGCEDWLPETSARYRIDKVLSRAEDGQIVLLHDSDWNVNTVEALRTIIPELQKRGVRFVTCAGLFEEVGVTPVPGRLYSNVYQTGNRP